MPLQSVLHALGRYAGRGAQAARVSVLWLANLRRAGQPTRSGAPSDRPAEVKRLELVGGPLDGRECAPNERPEFMWVRIDGKNVRCSTDDREGSLLYRREKKSRYIYAGDTHMRCGGCRGYTVRGARCGGCAAPLRSR